MTSNTYVALIFLLVIIVRATYSFNSSNKPRRFVYY